jgi:hypothetical protein
MTEGNLVELFSRELLDLVPRGLRHSALTGVR